MDSYNYSDEIKEKNKNTSNNKGTKVVFFVLGGIFLFN